MLKSVCALVASMFLLLVIDASADAAEVWIDQVSRPARSASLVSGTGLSPSLQTVSTPTGSTAGLRTANLNGLAILSDSPDLQYSAVQIGVGNKAAGSSSGESNLLAVLQSGSGNNIELLQEGSSNLLMLIQLSLGNDMKVAQRGENQVMSAAQAGMSNVMALQQTGTFNMMAVQQSGSANIISATQTGSGNRLVGIQR